MKTNDQKKSSKKSNQPNHFLRLTGVGIQMGVTIFFGAYLGKWLDQRYSDEKKWFTIAFTLLAVAISLYNVIKQLNKINNTKKDD